jgi:hypothetical protein
MSNTCTVDPRRSQGSENQSTVEKPVVISGTATFCKRLLAREEIVDTRSETKFTKKIRQN